MGLFSLFSIADQVFGDRFQLLEHGLFWVILLCSWILFKFFAAESERVVDLGTTRGAVVLGLGLTLAATWSIRDFSYPLLTRALSPSSEEVVEGVWKFDFPSSRTNWCGNAP